jgi:hypothetical protein
MLSRCPLTGILLVALTTGTDVWVYVTVFVTVSVICGPTVKVKSRSYAKGLPLPLLPITRMVQFPELIWSFSNGHVESCDVLLGTSNKSVMSPFVCGKFEVLTSWDGSAFPFIFGRLLHKEHVCTIVVTAAELLHCREIHCAVGVDKIASAINEVDAIDRAV